MQFWYFWYILMNSIFSQLALDSAYLPTFLEFLESSRISARWTFRKCAAFAGTNPTVW